MRFGALSGGGRKRLVDEHNKKGGKDTVDIEWWRSFGFFVTKGDILRKKLYGRTPLYYYHHTYRTSHVRCVGTKQ